MAEEVTKRWDAFVSHASEDKDVVRPLVAALTSAGCAVWYDETALKLGDSLRGAIDKGLANSRYGIVILSPNFFAKHWPQAELDALAGRESAGLKVILPIWHNLRLEQVEQFSPMLAGRLAVSTSSGLDVVARQILAVILAGAPLVLQREMGVMPLSLDLDGDLVTVLQAIAYYGSAEVTATTIAARLSTPEPRIAPLIKQLQMMHFVAFTQVSLHGVFAKRYSTTALGRRFLTEKGLPSGVSAARSVPP